VIRLSYTEKLLTDSGGIFRETFQAIFHLRHVAQRKENMNLKAALSLCHLTEREHVCCLCARPGKKQGRHGTGVRTRFDELGENGRR
jgi:hypothetical protein